MEDKFYFAKGTVRYKKDGWVIVEVPLNIVNYYRWWVEKFTWKKTSTSYHGAHISIFSPKWEGDKKTHPLWGLHEGEKVEFKYYSTIFSDNEGYSWLKVECPMADKIRKELGLPEKRHVPLHTTICYCDY